MAMDLNVEMTRMMPMAPPSDKIIMEDTEASVATTNRHMEVDKMTLTISQLMEARTVGMMMTIDVAVLKVMDVRTARTTMMTDVGVVKPMDTRTVGMTMMTNAEQGKVLDIRHVGMMMIIDVQVVKDMDSRLAGMTTTTDVGVIKAMEVKLTGQNTAKIPTNKIIPAPTNLDVIVIQIVTTTRSCKRINLKLAMADRVPM